MPQLTVAENIFLGHELTRGGLIGRRAQEKRAGELLDGLGLDIRPSRRIDSLTVADQQLVEITRALSRDFSVLVMDEPTAALNDSEVQRLLAMVERLSAAGTAVVYVSHRLPEVMRIATTVTVLRDGVAVADMPMTGVDETQLVELMLGRSLEAESGATAAVGSTSTEDPVLTVREVRTSGLTAPISFEVRAGEVLGIAGLVGSGRSELLRAIYGMQRLGDGEVRVRGKRVDNSSPAGAIRSGVFMLTEDRKSEGILPHLSVLENTVIAEPRRTLVDPRRWLTSDSAERKTFGTLKDRLRIRVDRSDRLIGSLSGGNQQKVLFARAVISGCTVLLLNEPTRGVDVGAKVEIYQLIRRLASEGVAVVVSSSEASELVALAGRCLVLYAGRLQETIAARDISEETIVTASLGQSVGEAA